MGELELFEAVLSKGSDDNVLPLFEAKNSWANLLNCSFL